MLPRLIWGWDLPRERREPRGPARSAKLEPTRERGSSDTPPCVMLSSDYIIITPMTVALVSIRIPRIPSHQLLQLPELQTHLPALKI
jgi:hypothetical protein